MHIQTAYSSQATITGAVAELKQQLAGFEPKLLLFFASSSYDPAALSAAMQQSFSPGTVMGCTTAGEIISGKMLKNSIVAMAFAETALAAAHLEVITDLGDASSVSAALAGLQQRLGVPLAQLDPQRHVGLILIDGLSKAEERVMDQVGDKTNIYFIGGSAGDDLKFSQTYVMAGGRAYTNAALLAVLQPKLEFSFIKTQSFCPLSQTLTATKVNQAERKVLEFNGKPAAQAYAEALGVSIPEAGGRFMRNPVGLIADDQIFVRSPLQIQGDAMAFYCNVPEGMQLTLLDSTDIIADTRAALEAKQQELGSISGIINFHCILRTLELEQRGLTDAYGQLFSAIPTIGFSTYGEEFLGHINQTATMLVFK